MEYPELGGIGTTLGMAPEWKMVLGAAYTTPVADYGHVTFRGTFTQSDEYTFTIKPWHKEDGYSMVNASILFETADGRWSIEAYGTNLGDEEYL